MIHVEIKKIIPKNVMRRWLLKHSKPLLEEIPDMYNNRTEPSQDQITAVLEIVKEHNRFNPITGRQILNTLDIKSDIEIRQIIAELRLQNYPISSDSGGYWYSSDPADLSETIIGMQSRINKMQAVVDQLRKTMNVMLADSTNTSNDNHLIHIEGGTIDISTCIGGDRS